MRENAPAEINKEILSSLLHEQTWRDAEIERLRALCWTIASGCEQCREGLAVSGQARGKIYHALKAYAIRLRKAAGRGEEL
jgi:hypothetical protein